MEPNPKGWGQILQTIGRGIRRGTHQGLCDERMRTVRTTIYTTVLEQQWVEDTRREQIDAVNSDLTLQHTAYHTAYKELKGLVEERNLAADPTKAYKDRKQKRESGLKKNLKAYAKNIQKLSADRAKLRDGWLRVKTGKMSHRKGVSSPKQAMVQAFHLLPDEAVLHVTWREEMSRARFDKIIKDAAVDALLLQDFHKISPATQTQVDDRESFMQELDGKFRSAKLQKFQAQDTLVPTVGILASTPALCCNICNVKSSGSQRQSGSQMCGVACRSQHFVCSACYISLYTQNTLELSAKDAQRHYLQTVSVECSESVCFASFCIDHSQLAQLLKFPLYWKAQQTDKVHVYPNSFMKDRLQTLIRESVRQDCGSGCSGRDGDGRGTTSAVVTKVFRIENGPLWKRYWEKKKNLIEVERVKQKVEATSMGISNLFPMVELNQNINELFLFHGTNEQSAGLIAENGFDPSRGGGLYGAGSYCADYSCKSMQYAGGQRPLPGQERIFLICRVLMGRAYQTKTALSQIKEPPENDLGERCHSVFAKEGVVWNGSHWQTHNEYITYHSDQIYPEYLVHVKL